jgi:D-alanine--poly(phosphoribitol) ligase subunit 2
MTDTERSILDFIEELRAGESVGTLRPDTQLMELGLLDSMGLVRLIQFIEQRFGIAIPDADVTPDLFATPGDLAAYVTERA